MQHAASRCSPLKTLSSVFTAPLLQVRARKPSLAHSNTEILQFRRLLWSRPSENKGGTDRQDVDQSE